MSEDELRAGLEDELSPGARVFVEKGVALLSAEFGLGPAEGSFVFRTLYDEQPGFMSRYFPEDRPLDQIEFDPHLEELRDIAQVYVSVRSGRE